LPRDRALIGFELAGSMQPASQVGGDFYDVVRFGDPGDDRFWLMIGDVSGHGLDAGLFVLMAQAAAQATLRAQPNTSPRQLVAHVNRIIHENMNQRLQRRGFVTFMVLRHGGGGHFDVAGSHLPVYVIRKDGRAETVEPTGPWCGIRPEILHQLDAVEVQLGEGDLLCLITDGITEARDGDGRVFGEERLVAELQAVATAPPAAALERLLARVRAFQVAQEDDMTVVLLKRGTAATPPGS
jgi:phosphoserine phosphatase RsbU/P